MSAFPKAPLYAYPLERLAEIIGPIALAVRTLPDAQLAAEFEQLSVICAEPDGHYAEDVLHRVYEAELERRASPEQKFDDDLHAALSRLERHTTAEDRHTVREIGDRLVRIGGREALRAAYRRMIERAHPKRRDLRKKIIQRRWAGLIDAPSAK